jgi:2-dehydro-3-deoxygalactonokinase
MTHALTPGWIAADWGTTNLRVWAMSPSGTVLATATSSDGMGTLDRAGYEPALLALIGDWLTGAPPVIACGMVGSRQGWIEAPYATTPCPATPIGFVCPAVNDPRLAVHIIPGIKQTAPADVMRGEETQIAGYLALNPGFDGVICLPGTHTKWAHISAGEVVSFQTFMTGDLFAAISQHTVLRHSMGDGWDNDGFAQGLDDAFTRPEKLAARLFSLRAEGLVHGLASAVARARLSGLLIGAELAAAKPYWLGQNVAVVGEGRLSRLYVAALATQSVHATQANGDRTTLAGLTAAYRRLKEDKTCPAP